MFQRVLRRAAIARYRQVLATSMVVPHDEPVVASGRSDALRVLVLGSGIASGQGVGTYGLALIGALQRSLQVRLHRPVDVELVRQHGAGIEQAAAIAADRIGEDWDAFVLAFGVSDALRLTPAAAWRRGLGLLLSTIEDRKTSPFRVPVLVAGIPPLTTFGAHQGPLMPVLSRHATALDRATQRLLAGHPAARFVPLPTMRAAQAGRFGSPSSYEGWAEVLADRLAPMLEGSLTRVARPGETHDAEPEALALLAALPSGARERLQALAAQARRALDADVAAVRLVRGDRLCIVADSSGSVARSMPVTGSICTVTMADGIVLTEDVEDEPRLAALPGLTAHGIRSYAGVALHDASGDVVGTLCVLGGGAGRPGQEAVLRDLARAAEAELVVGAAPAASAEATAPAVTALGDDPEVAVDRDDASALPAWPQRMRMRLLNAGMLRTQGSRLARVPTERTAPALRSLSVPGPDPLRLLMLGGEYAMGYGVDDRAQALDGQLARLLHRRTGRGVEVRNRADDRLALREMSLQMGPAGAAGYDVVVWTPTFREAVRSPWRAAWVIGLTGLIRYVQATSGAPVVLMGFPALIGHQPLAVLARGRARQLNQMFRLVAARSSGTWVAEPSPVVLNDVETVDGAATYRAAAVHMFATVCEALQSRDVGSDGPEGARRGTGPEGSDRIRSVAR